jgi:hypothetical protein
LKEIGPPEKVQFDAGRPYRDGLGGRNNRGSGIDECHWRRNFDETGPPQNVLKPMEAALTSRESLFSARLLAN